MLLLKLLAHLLELSDSAGALNCSILLLSILSPLGVQRLSPRPWPWPRPPTCWGGAFMWRGLALFSWSREISLQWAWEEHEKGTPTGDTPTKSSTQSRSAESKVHSIRRSDGRGAEEELPLVASAHSWGSCGCRCCRSRKLTLCTLPLCQDTSSCKVAGQ